MSMHLAVVATASAQVTAFQAIVLGLLQGITELFPISSLGHTVILPRLLGWNINQSADNFLPFVTALHLGTAIALIVYFRREWIAILVPMLRSIQRGSLSDDANERLGWLVAVGTVPAAVLGVFLEKTVKSLFADPKVAAAFLVVNGFVLYFGEHLRVRAQAAHTPAGNQHGTIDRNETAPRAVTTLGWGEAFVVGASQVLAFLPGISRSGVTMVAGLATGLSHETAARFTFLLATPVILGAALVEIPSLFGSSLLGMSILGGVMAGIAAYFSVRFLMRYFTTNRLDPFAYYCWIAGALSFAILALR
ncbi:MAG TPA: undecaprenyl-diphosphate phosphatase [Chloroflexota bacterium]|nr:undecaprenyl-diphosphate phosphatase [Chloroflexota bacterium]